VSRLSDLLLKQELSGAEKSEARDLVEFLEQVVRDLSGTITGQNKFTNLSSRRLIMDNSGLTVNSTGTAAADTALRAFRLFNQGYNEHFSMNLYDKSGDNISAGLAVRGPGSGTTRFPSLAYTFQWDDANQDEWNHQLVIAPTSGNNHRLIYRLLDNGTNRAELFFTGAGDYATGQGFDRRFDFENAFIQKNDAGIFAIANSTSGSSVQIQDSFFSLELGGELTIATGAITATQSYHSVDTQDDDATDDLDTINGAATGNILVLVAANSARTVVVKDSSGNIKLEGDFSMDNVNDTLTLIGRTTEWLELSRTNAEA